MAIFRCGKCEHLREIPNNYIGKSIACPRCQNSVIIFDTVIFIQKVLEKYIDLRVQMSELQATEKPELNNSETVDLLDIDIHDSTAFASQEQYAPIMEWFKCKQIDMDIDHKAVDTTGFFDEIALNLGDNYALLKDVSGKISRTQRGNYTSTTLNLSDYSKKDGQAIHTFCKALHQYSFLAKCFYKKDQQKLYLTLQTAPVITNFFNGEWLEWYVFIKLAGLCRDAKVPISILRSIDVTFPNGARNELDLFLLLNGQQAVCIECKSGEFRSQINKYVKLCKKLKLDKSAFWLIVADLSDEQAKGLSAMYGLSFYNEAGFIQAFADFLT